MLKYYFNTERKKMELQEYAYHVPVLLPESLEGLAIRPQGIYVDVTFGGGGHSREILKQLGEGGHLYGFDQDADAEQISLRTHGLRLCGVTSVICTISCVTMAGSGRWMVCWRT